jgi:hypothetical protein
VSLNYAVLNYASRYKEELLLNIYTMGSNSIEAGNKDSWTLYPKRADALTELLKTEKLTGNIDSFRTTVYNKVYKNPANRDARGYIVTANQTTTAIDFINILIQSGIRVEKATTNFKVGDKEYEAGSYVVKTNQAFRPHVIDMFEPQDHPNDFQYPGGPPIRPYDAAGWTPAFTMGIEFDRVLDDFNGPFETIAYGFVQKPIGKINASGEIAGYSFSTKENAAYYAINTLLAMGVEVYKNKDQYFVTANAASKKIQAAIETLSAEKGIIFNGLTAKPTNMNDKVMPQRIALWDRYGGSMSSGWVRWIFEKYNFPFQLIYAKEIDASNLKDKYDVIVFVEGAIPSLKPEASNGYEEREPKTEDIPEMYQASLGKITAAKSIPALNTFLQNGGTIVTIGSSANLAYHLNLPVRNALVEMVSGKEKSLPGEKYYIPGSVMQITLDNEYKANWGMHKNADVYFNASPVFNLLPDAIARKEIVPLAWYASDKTLRSGWAFGQSYLQDGIAAFEAKVGSGKLFVYGPEITFRGQTHSTYKMLFNQLYK